MNHFVMNLVRPHPGPLPQEREREMDRQKTMSSLPRSTMQRTRRGTLTYPKRWPRPLSPGERAGVRASVNLNPDCRR